MEKIFSEKNVIMVVDLKCPKCGTVYRENGTSFYLCENCGYEEPTNFGIVRDYLHEHGNASASALEISRDTGISVREINSFLRKGRLEIPENSKVFISCKRCGVDLRYGKYCPACANELAKELKEAFDPTTIGAIPRSYNMTGKMHHRKMERD